MIGKLAKSIHYVEGSLLIACVNIRTVLGLGPCLPYGLCLKFRKCSLLVELELFWDAFGMTAVRNSNSTRQLSICSLYLSLYGAEIWLSDDFLNYLASDIAFKEFKILVICFGSGSKWWEWCKWLYLNRVYLTNLIFEDQIMYLLSIRSQ